MKHYKLKLLILRSLIQTKLNITKIKLVAIPHKISTFVINIGILDVSLNLRSKT